MFFIVFFCAIVGVYGIFIGGHTRYVINFIDSFIGFSIDKVRIIGNVETLEGDVIRCLELNRSTSLISFDAVKIQNNLLSLPWIANAEIHKVYPDTIEIRLTERIPYAIWQNNSSLYLIDKNGYVISSLKNTRFSYLPMLIGENINKAIRSFEKLSTIEEITKLVKSYHWVAERRWDLHLYNGIIIKLPEEKFDTAISNILELQDKYKILDRDISIIDMRLPDRLAIRLTVGSFIDRQDIVDKRNLELNRG
ncbi:cell division protein FtsQ/DivIB [Candidatus Liberibacter africanus]|uniref:cell division protein FtsQ/DivIB n=1 Tax=Liberibacter africanus TaxID=34020 RepID=UPI001FD038C4|nr:FtsQ-type POTRA domain-containing protein [Candidatus Liberibacter africanus]